MLEDLWQFLMLAAFVLIAFGSAFFVLIVTPLDAKTPVEADTGTSSAQLDEAQFDEAQFDEAQLDEAQFDEAQLDGPLSARLSFAGAGLPDGLPDGL